VATVSVDVKLTPVGASIPIPMTLDLSWVAGRDERGFSGSKIAEWQYTSA